MEIKRTEASRVFVVQRPAVRTAQGWVDKYDLTSAALYGRLVDVLPPGNIPPITGPTVGRIQDALKDYQEHDFLLTLGDPVAIAAAAAIAARLTDGRLQVLKWDRHNSEYRAYGLDVL